MFACLSFTLYVSLHVSCRSVLILNGNGADVAKHCIPAVPTKRYYILLASRLKLSKISSINTQCYTVDPFRRISITFRKMDDSKLPYKFTPDPELQGIRPLSFDRLNKSPVQQKEDKIVTSTNESFVIEKDDFPPLGGSTSSNKRNKHPKP